MKQEQHIINAMQRLAFSASKHINESIPAKIAARLESETEHAPAPLSLTECHVIDAIGSTEQAKAIDIARSINITRGGVSKILTRLETKGYVTESAREDNKKERALALTPLGFRVFSIHQELHDANIQRWVRMLGNFSEADKALLCEMLDKILDEFGEDN